MDLPGFRYLLHDFLEDVASGHNIVATVFNECQAMYRARGPKEMKPVGEVEFCAGVAAMSDSGIYGTTRVNAGIVGFADLTLGDRVAPVLEAQIAAGGGRFKGVRHAAGWDASPVIGNSHTSPGPGLYQRPELRAGLRRLTSYGLSLDAWVFHPQLADAVDLARSCPDANIVMCHMGGPLGYGPYTGQQAEVFSVWKAGMTELAKCPNVSVKLGGVMMRLAAYDYGKSDRPASSEELAKLWKPYVTTCVELFGADRCMVESNFPVEKMGIGYPVSGTPSSVCWSEPRTPRKRPFSPDRGKGLPDRLDRLRERNGQLGPEPSRVLLLAKARNPSHSGSRPGRRSSDGNFARFRWSGLLRRDYSSSSACKRRAPRTGHSYCATARPFLAFADGEAEAFGLAQAPGFSPIDLRQWSC